MPFSETIGHGKALDSQDSRSPLAGEGAGTCSAACGDTRRCDIHLFTCQTAVFVPAARWRPGVELDPTFEGWAERRQAHGCSGIRWGPYMTRRARRLRGALRPIVRRKTRVNALMT